MRVTIPRWRPFPDNQLAGGIHWAVRRRRKQADADIVALFCRDLPKAEGKRRVSLEITLTGRQKKADPWAYCKSLNDALVKCGMLVDDSEEWVEWGGVTYSRGDEGSTTIILEDCDDRVR